MNDERRLSLIQLYLASNQTKSEFEKENGLGRASISKWLRTFAIEDKTSSVRLPPPMSTLQTESNLEDPAEEIRLLKLALKKKDLELKQATMARDAYEKMIEIAETKYAIPIRKNSGAK
ncbi:MAG: hypothetical protein ACI4UA_03045 [Bacteroidaceae bacterium]